VFSFFQFIVMVFDLLHIKDVRRLPFILGHFPLSSHFEKRPWTKFPVSSPPKTLHSLLLVFALEFNSFFSYGLKMRFFLFYADAVGEGTLPSQSCFGIVCGLGMGTFFFFFPMGFCSFFDPGDCVSPHEWFLYSAGSTASFLRILPNLPHLGYGRPSFRTYLPPWFFPCFFFSRRFPLGGRFFYKAYKLFPRTRSPSLS